MPSLNRRDYFTDDILGQLLAQINEGEQRAFLYSVYQTLQQENDTAFPHVCYGVLTEPTPREGEDYETIKDAITYFQIQIAVFGSQDLDNAGTNRKLVNDIICRIENAINNVQTCFDAWEDMFGNAVIVKKVMTTGVTPTPDFGDPFSAFTMSGQILWDGGNPNA